MTPSILVIEDDPNMLALIEEALEDEGYITAGAASAVAAIELAKRQAYDLVISDIRMPGELDGLGALEWIKRHHPKTLCIVMTGFADEEAPMRAVQIQVNNYLYKPFGLQDVLQAVKDVLESARERTSYEKLFHRLWKTPRTLLDTLDRTRRDSAARKLDQSRDEAFQSLFTLIRSRKLSKGAALVCWDRLEVIEERHSQYERDPKSFGNEQLVAGAESYAQLRAQMEQMARAGSQGVMKSRDSNQVPIPAFHQMYDRLLGGRLNFEQVRAAPGLRRLSREERARDPELTELYRRLWERDSSPAMSASLERTRSGGALPV